MKEGTLGITNHYTGSLQSEGSGTSFDVSEGGKYMVQDNWHDYGETSAQNFKLSGFGTVTEQGGAVYMNSATPFEIDDFQGDITLMGLQFIGGFVLSPQNKQTNLLNLGLVGSSALYLPSSIGSATVGNVLDSQSGAHIPQGTTPDTLWMRSMLAQTRSEYPISRRPLAAGSSRIRISRVVVDSTLAAIHLQPESLLPGLSYLIQSGPWMLTTSQGSCVGTSTDVSAKHNWLLMSAGEGDFELVATDTGMALGFATSVNNSLTVEPLTDHTTSDGLWQTRVTEHSP